MDSQDINTQEKMLEWAIHEAVTQHFGKVDKAGMPYILHPLRVMMAMETLEEKIVAVLHDVAEDGFLPRSRLIEYTSGKIAEAVYTVTRGNQESYEDFIQRIRKNELATRVKIADLHDNLDRSRIKNPTEKDLQRFQKYEKALIALQGVAKTKPDYQGKLRRKKQNQKEVF
ncbi:MAG: hypothetical protein HQM08_03710 [Candidatus Riflebacteria bacterium]|nr:hypothetical protein [Candidatus Riflebacteria bacterium]